MTHLLSLVPAVPVWLAPTLLTLGLTLLTRELLGAAVRFVRPGQRDAAMIRKLENDLIAARQERDVFARQVAELDNDSNVWVPSLNGDSIQCVKLSDVLSELKALREGATITASPDDSEKLYSVPAHEGSDDDLPDLLTGEELVDSLVTSRRLRHALNKQVLELTRFREDVRHGDAKYEVNDCGEKRLLTVPELVREIDAERAEGQKFLSANRVLGEANLALTAAKKSLETRVGELLREAGARKAEVERVTAELRTERNKPAGGPRMHGIHNGTTNKTELSPEPAEVSETFGTTLYDDTVNLWKSWVVMQRYGEKRDLKTYLGANRATATFSPWNMRVSYN